MVINLRSLPGLAPASATGPNPGPNPAPVSAPNPALLLLLLLPLFLILPCSCTDPTFSIWKKETIDFSQILFKIITLLHCIEWHQNILGPFKIKEYFGIKIGAKVTNL